jgi:hypothetical protein
MGDVEKSAAIVLVFGVLIGNLTMVIGKKEIQDNWPLYRCNPLLMPVASSFAPDGSTVTTEENFSYCIQETMTQFAPNVLQPLQYVQAATMDLLGDLATSSQTTTKAQSMFSFNVGSMFENIFGVFGGVMLQVSLIMAKLQDTQGKIMGSIVTMLYIMTTVDKTFQSMWNGIPGKLIKSFSKIKK